jgi:hypothetical protein
MHFVYATGQPGQFDFNLAQTRAGVPSGARVFATCTGESLAEMLDEHTFHAMSDGEFYELQALIRKARQLEAERKRLRGSGVLDRISRWLLGRQSAKAVNHRPLDHLRLT